MRNLDATVKIDMSIYQGLPDQPKILCVMILAVYF